MKAVEIRPNNNCVDCYREPDESWWPNAIVEDLSKVCSEVMVEVATYLEHTGVVGVSLSHLQTPAFWDLMQVCYQAVEDCQKQLSDEALKQPMEVREDTLPHGR